VDQEEKYGVGGVRRNPDEKQANSLTRTLISDGLTNKIEN
jgi:hypothetical protein